MSDPTVELELLITELRDKRILPADAAADLLVGMQSCERSVRIRLLGRMQGWRESGHLAPHDVDSYITRLGLPKEETDAFLERMRTNHDRKRSLN